MFHFGIPHLLYRTVQTGDCPWFPWFPETYLSDAFINIVRNDKELIRKFVESNPEFKKRSLKLNDIFKRLDHLDNEIVGYLTEQVWHRLSVVKEMYASTLDIHFPKDLGYIFGAIAIRHDIVHRGGKKVDGSEINLCKADLWKLIEKISLLVDSIDEKLPKT